MSHERDRTERWVDIAAEAAQHVNFVAHGEKQNAYIEIGREYDLSPNHIRRMVRALTFTVEISPKHPKLAEALRCRTFKAAEIIDRWHARDPAAAIAGAERFVAGDFTLKRLDTVAAGEKAAPAAFKIDSSRLDLAAFRKAAWKKLETTVGYELTPADDIEALAHLSAIDGIVKGRGKSKRWALIIVEPGLTMRAYLERREVDLGRALALKALAIRPAFAIPVEANPGEFRDVLKAFGQSDVIVLEIGIVAAYG
jgi:hypothetical protein